MTVWTILAACGAMFIIDVLAAMKTAAIGKQRAWLAGQLDGGIGFFSNIYAVFGAVSIGKYGWGLMTWIMLAALYVTDVFSTEVGTRLGGEIRGNRR